VHLLLWSKKQLHMMSERLGRFSHAGNMWIGAGVVGANGHISRARQKKTATPAGEGARLGQHILRCRLNEYHYTVSERW